MRKVDRFASKKVTLSLHS